MKQSIIIFFLVYISISFALKGIVDLDDVSWSRIADGSKPLLVAFQEYSWKNPKEYEKVSEEFKSEKVIVAKVDCSSNSELKKKFDIQTYPTIKFFAVGDTENGATYSGADSSNDLIDFVRLQLNPQLLELKKIASDFTTQTDKRSNLLASAEKIVNSLSEADKEYASYFISAMKKTLEKSDFLTTEKERLNGLVSSKSTTEKKKAEFTKKLNILNAFKAQESP